MVSPNDFDSLALVARRLNGFEGHYNQIAQPFDWRFSRADLRALLERLSSHEPQLRLVA